MMKFDRDNVIELKDFLYNSCVHDAKIENVGYQYGKMRYKSNYSIQSLMSR